MATISPPTIATIHSFPTQSTPNLTNSLLIPIRMYMYFITYLPILTTSPAAIFNWPINSFCPVNTVLVLTSDNFHSFFSPSPPFLPLFLFLPWWLLLETITWCHLSMYSHTFILFWLKKTSLIVKTYQLSFHMFICAFNLVIS